MRLSAGDLEAVLGFLADVGGLDFDELYPAELLARLRELVPCDSAAYQVLEPSREQILAFVGVADRDGGNADPAAYWALGPCPIVHYRLNSLDVTTVRMSDVISRRRFRELPIYREFFRPAGGEHAVDLGLPSSPGRHRSFILFRGKDVRNFSARDRAVLELLRPHLLHLEADAALRRQLQELTAAVAAGADPAALSALTPREREVVELVAEGKTNAEIAARLWVAPSTVKKHLEHVYAKLGVGRRAAVAARWRGGGGQLRTSSSGGGPGRSIDAPIATSSVATITPSETKIGIL